MQHTLFEAPTAAQTAPTNRQELQKLFFGNGGNCPPTIVFHEDPGHGWLQVPKPLAKQLGITGKISGYSYQDTKNVYLEEDCDFSLFYDAMKIRQNGLHKDFWEMCPKEYKEESPIRRKTRYTTK